MIVNWITPFLDATDFIMSGQCGQWTDSLRLFYVTSNALIVVAYLIIATCLFTIWTNRRHEILFSSLLPLFASSIAACALTHACDIAAIWWPEHRLFTLVSCVTAVFSIFTALVLPELTKTVLALPSPSVFQEVNRELESAIALKENAISELADTVAALRRQVNHLERMRQTGLWVAEQESALRELKTVLASSSNKEGTQ